MIETSPTGSTIGLRKLDTVALVGTHGSGKSTLAVPLAQRLGLQPITYSRPTQAAKDMGYEKAADVPPESRQLFQWFALFNQVAAEKKHERFVADRGTIDFWAYWMVETPDQLKEFNYASACERYARRYDMIVYLPPPSWGVVDDGRRYTEKTLEIDEAIRTILGDLDIWDNVAVVSPGTSVEERLDEVINWVQEKGWLL